MASIGDLMMRVIADMTGFEADLVKSGEKAGDKAGQSTGQRFAKAISSNTTKAFTAAGAVGGALFTGAIGGAANFEDQLRTINTVAHLTDDQLKGVGQSILDLSKETGKSTDDLTAGFYDLVSAGVPAEKAIGVLKDSAVLATGALGSTAETVDLITSALNAYGLEASASTKITDIFAQAVADGKVTAAELGTSLANIAPIAASAGVSLEEVSAGYAVLTAKGVPAAQAATQMRAAISALLTPNEQLNDIQKETGKNFAQLAKAKGLAVALEELRKATGGNAEAFAKALGSVEAYQFAVQSTGDNAAAFATELEKVTTASEEGGVAQGQYEERMKSAKMQAEKFVAGLRATALEIGGPFVDSLGAGVLALNELGGGMGGLVNLSRLFGGALGGVAGFLTSKLGPRLKDVGVKLAAKIAAGMASTAAVNALTTAAGDGLETAMTAGVEKAAKSSAVKSALMRGIGLLSTLAPPILIGLALAPVAQEIKDEAMRQADEIARAAQNSGDQAKIDQAIKNLGAVKRGAHYTGDAAAEAYVDALILGLQTGGQGIDAASKVAAESAVDTTAQALAAGEPTVEAGATAMLDGVPTAIEKSAALAKSLAKDIPLRIADGIRASREMVAGALQILREALKNEMSPAKERATLLGELASKELAKGMKSKDPVVRQAAKDAKDAIMQRLEELIPANGKLGKKQAEALKAAMNSKNPAIRAAAKEWKDKIEAKLKETKAKQLGKNIGQGVKDGIVSKKGAIGTAVYNLGKYIGKKLASGITIYIGRQVPEPKALGGPVKAGVPYMTGEKGRELFVPQTDGHIYTASETAALEAGGGGTTINLQTYGLPMRAETPAEVVHRVRRATRLGIVAPPRRTPAWRPG